MGSAHGQHEIEQKVREWHTLLNGQDDNYPGKQVRALVFRAQVFRTFMGIEELRSGTEPDFEPNINYLLWDELWRGYVERQSSAIRRLCERQNERKEKKVTSLRSLVCDVIKCASRYPNIDSAELIIAYKLVQPTKETANAIEYVRANPGEYRMFSDGPELEAKLHDIDSKLIKCNKLCTYVDKYIAHAASIDSRELVYAKDSALRKITYGDIFNAEKNIWNAYQSLRWLLFRSDDTNRIYFSYNRFEYLDIPLVKCEEIAIIKEKWDRVESEINKWFSAEKR